MGLLTSPSDAPDAEPVPPATVTPNPWGELRRFTDARIALGRAGVSLPTQPQLAFQLAHAQARDAVHLALDAQAVQAALRGLGQKVLRLHSAAVDRHTYLQRPDLGRRLDGPSREALNAWRTDNALLCMGPAPAVGHAAVDSAGHAADARPFDVAFVVADGLSPLAIGLHALPLLRCVLPPLRAEGWRIAPLTLVEQSRVALADEVGELLGAKLVVILIGERPGLSSPDSMGLYLTWMPRVGLTDAHRNCISNIRQAGLPYEDAARKLHVLLSEARRLRVSGVSLKEG
jgi:ethanolamine ammonia-lyase small subunit